MLPRILSLSRLASVLCALAALGLPAARAEPAAAEPRRTGQLEIWIADSTYGHVGGVVGHCAPVFDGVFHDFSVGSLSERSSTYATKTPEGALRDFARHGQGMTHYVIRATPDQLAKIRAGLPETAEWYKSRKYWFGHTCVNGTARCIRKGIPSFPEGGNCTPQGYKKLLEDSGLVERSYRTEAPPPAGPAFVAPGRQNGLIPLGY